MSSPTKPATGLGMEIAAGIVAIGGVLTTALLWPAGRDTSTLPAGVSADPPLDRAGIALAVIAGAVIVLIGVVLYVGAQLVEGLGRRADVS
jgi:hypothetical protein